MSITGRLFAAVLTLIAGSSWFDQAVGAATLENTPHVQTAATNCSLRVSGEIEKGDAAVIRQTIEPVVSQIYNYPSPDYDEQYVVCLSGPGGNCLEGVKLAKIFAAGHAFT